jgi:D-beta-D-heptose 7-phosphate kinase/D-beta-D-heptose 1-phosphate adenosyltransferase
MSVADLLTTFQNLGHPRLLAIGDFILDRYTWGNTERTSQEAPVVVLLADHGEDRLGGAANVCHMLRGLEAEVTCAGVVGSDENGQTVRRLLSQAGVDTTLLMTDPTRPTTVKERFIGRAQGRHSHQILRVDREVTTPLESKIESQFLDGIRAQIGRHDLVVVSDYGKGVCTPRLLAGIVSAAKAAGVPVVVDPNRNADFTNYRGVTAMTPNRTEAGAATGTKIETIDQAFAAGRILCDRLGLAMAIVTLDRDGMALVHADGRSEIFPTYPRAVYDVTGAGDMVLAMIGACLADGLTPADAVRLGNIAGGLEVEKVGVAVIPRGEICDRLLAERTASLGKLVSFKELLTLAEAQRRQGRKIVFTNGCFDLLHVGHITTLQEASRLGDVLVVAVNSDESVRKLKGDGRPLVTQENRAALLAALACVNYVVLFDADTPVELLKQLRPEVLVKGGDYRPDEIVGYEVVNGYGGKVHLARKVDGISTAQIVGRARGESAS